MCSRASKKRQQSGLGGKLILERKNMLDGIRTRNPQIRSLVRYPLRHEHLLERGQGGRNDVYARTKTKSEKKYLVDN